VTNNVHYCFYNLLTCIFSVLSILLYAAVENNFIQVNRNVATFCHLTSNQQTYNFEFSLEINMSLTLFQVHVITPILSRFNKLTDATKFNSKGEYQ